jgi:hypothetical protein
MFAVKNRFCEGAVADSRVGLFFMAVALLFVQYDAGTT